MNRKFSIALAILAVAVLGVAATDANAQCPVPKEFKTAFSAATNGGSSFIVFPPDANTDQAALKGHFWQSGNRAAGNEGSSCPNVAWLFVDADGSVSGTTGAVAVYGAIGGAILDPNIPCVATTCIVGNMTVLVQANSDDGSKSYFAIAKVAETDGFDFSTLTPNANWTILESPRARVTQSGRAGGNVTVNIHLDAPSLYGKAPTPSDVNGLITGYQIFRVNSNTDPGRAPAAWGAAIQTIPTTDTGADLNGLVIDCSGVTTDVFLGTRAVFEGEQLQPDAG
jgi:hypothetical protein